jgi:Leucine-rich repeat (LRR) protein
MLYFFLCVLLSPLLATSIDVEVSSGGAPTTTPLSSSSSTLSTNDIQVLRKLEKLALINLYTATKGAMWRDNQNWLQGDPCMQSWYGVQCNELLLVDSIKLAANRLNGTIPDVFSDLSQVKDLDLSLNYLKGPLPASMSQLILLKNLDIGYNYLLISLRTFEHFKHLEMLTLRWNTLITGSLRDLQHCTSLHTINFRDNTMESLTLDGIEQLTALLHVDLTKSGLRGVLHIRHLHGLVSFNAANNYLSGSIAKTIEEGLTSTTISTTQYNLSLLEELDLSNNMLTGPVPLLASAVQLQRLDLSNNEFVSSHLTLSDHLHLKELLLSGNRLEQHFPYDLYKLSQLEIFECSNCELFGVIGMPMGSLPALERFIVHNNRLVGQLPRAIWNMPQLTRLDVSHNQLVGRIHTAIKNAGNLEILRLSSNRFTGTIPQEMSFCLDLQEVRLEHNQFNGALPNIFVNEMNDLHTFSVHNNYLTSIPQTLLPRIQVWPLGLRPAATVSTGRSVSLVVYHNNIPSGNVGSHDGGDSSSTSTDTTTAVSSLPANHIAKDVPMFRVCGTMNDFYANTLLNAGWLRTDTERYHASYGLCWEENKPKDPKRILSIQRVSRFPDVGQVSDKGLLTNNIEIMRRKFPKEYSFYPTSFTIPNQLPEYIQEFNSVQATLQNNDENLWLMKPRARCCGEGIRIISNATASIDLVDPDLGEWYVQKFVSPPALIDGHKFVFRLFAVVTR